MRICGGWGAPCTGWASPLFWGLRGAPFSGVEPPPHPWVSKIKDLSCKARVPSTGGAKVEGVLGRKWSHPSPCLPLLLPLLPPPPPSFWNRGGSAGAEQLIFMNRNSIRRPFLGERGGAHKRAALLPPAGRGPRRSPSRGRSRFYCVNPFACQELLCTSIACAHAGRREGGRRLLRPPVTSAGATRRPDWLLSDLHPR